jgi:hypothetical protein
MAAQDTTTYGFNKPDSLDLLQLIGNGDGEYSEGRVRGGGGIKLYRFTLNASLASGTADADILLMDGTDTGTDADVLDPLGIFATLVTVGDAGLCLKQGGAYYVIQAPCP